MAPCTVYSPGTEARDERHDEMPAKGTQHGDRVQRDQGEDQPILDQRLALLGEESDAVVQRAAEFAELLTARRMERSGLVHRHPGDDGWR